MPDANRSSSAEESVVYEVTLPICWPCLKGDEGECHSPGCAFFICPAPTSEQSDRMRWHWDQQRRAEESE